MPYVKRREFLTLLGGAAAAWPLAARAQPSGKTYRIGFLGLTSLAETRPRVDALRTGLRQLGYEEGKNIVIHYRWAEGSYDRLPELAADLLKLNVDVLVTHGTPGALAAKQATSTVPIVMAAVGDPIEAGLVPSLARPGGNLTGMLRQAGRVDQRSGSDADPGRRFGQSFQSFTPHSSRGHEEHCRRSGSGTGAHRS
jgi:putative tryptophan/tyrosine transport system substrate-binding protein